MSIESPATEQVREQARQRIKDLSGFDYDAPAELFPSRSKTARNIPYKRFDTAAEAIRFAIEEIPPPALLGVCLEVDDGRFGAPRNSLPLRKRGLSPGARRREGRCGRSRKACLSSRGAERTGRLQRPNLRFSIWLEARSINCHRRACPGDLD